MSEMPEEELPVIQNAVAGMSKVLNGLRGESVLTSLTLMFIIASKQINPDGCPKELGKILSESVVEFWDDPLLIEALNPHKA